MLLYDNQQTFRILIHLNGSILYRWPNISVGLMLAGICLALQVLIERDSKYRPDIPNSLGLTVIGMITAFATVFRTNLAWERYWEAWAQAHLMYSKLSDSYSQLSVFCQTTIHRAGVEGTQVALEKAQWVEAIVTTFARHMSLFSALAANRLARGDTECVDKHFKTASWDSRVKMRQDMSVDSQIKVFQKRLSSSLQDVLPKSHTTSVALNKVAGLEEACSDLEFEALESASHRPSVVMLWLFACLSEASNELSIPAPIQTRIFQELSDCMVGYRYCEKIADVPFPFPYAQLLCVSLLFYSLLCPVYVACFTQSMVMGPIVTFVIFQLIYGINEVAKQMENPFGKDENDIQLNDFHWRFLDELADLNRSLGVVGEFRAKWKTEVQISAATLINQHDSHQRDEPQDGPKKCTRKNPETETAPARQRTSCASIVSTLRQGLGAEPVLGGTVDQDRPRAQSVVQPARQSALFSGQFQEGAILPWANPDIAAPPTVGTRIVLEPPEVPPLLVDDIDDTAIFESPALGKLPKTRAPNAVRLAGAQSSGTEPSAGTAESISFPKHILPSGDHVGIIDRQFAETWARMEAHLARIALLLDNTSGRSPGVPDHGALSRTDAQSVSEAFAYSSIQPFP